MFVRSDPDFPAVFAADSKFSSFRSENILFGRVVFFGPPIAFPPHTHATPSKREYSLYLSVGRKVQVYKFFFSKNYRARSSLSLSRRVLTSPYRVLELVFRVPSVRDSGWQ